MQADHQVGAEAPRGHADGHLGDPAQPLAVRRTEARPRPRPARRTAWCGRRRRAAIHQATPAAIAHWAICQRLDAPPVERGSPTEVRGRPRLQQPSSGLAPCARPGPPCRPIVPGHGGGDPIPSRPLGSPAWCTPSTRPRLAFLFAENRQMPMHVGGLQLFKKPEGAGRNYVRDLYEQMRDVDGHRAAVPQAPAPLGQDRPASGSGSRTTSSTSSTTSATARCPSPAGSASCSSCARGCTAPAWPRERPLWEAHLIEGLRDGRVAMYTKLHHALVDGVSAMRLLQSVLTTDPDERDMPAAVGARGRRAEARKASEDAEHACPTCRMQRAAHGARHHRRGRRAARRAGQDAQQEPAQRDLGAVALRPAHDPQPARSPASRRFAAQDWPLERLRAIGKATGTTLNDVVLAMCSGAMRTYLLELDALPDTPLVVDGPGRAQRQAVRSSPRPSGGNAVGAVMVQARHRPRRPGRPAQADPRLDDGRQGGAVAR